MSNASNKDSEMNHAPERGEQKHSLAELQEQLLVLKEQHEQEKGREKARYKELVQMAVEMVEGNKALADATKARPGGALPEAHQRALAQFEQNRKDEIGSRSADLRIRTDQLSEVKKTFRFLQEAGQISNEQIQEFQKQIQEQESEISAESETVKSLESSLKDDYNELAQKYRMIDYKQSTIANNPEQFAVETVLEMNQSEMSEEQQASFKADVETAIKEREEVARQTERLEELFQEIDFKEKLLQQFEEIFTQLKKKIESSIETFAQPLYQSQGLAPQVRERLEAQLKMIEKPLSSLIFSKGKSESTEQLIREARAAKEDYKNRALVIENLVLDLRNDSEYRDLNHDRSSDVAIKLSRITLKDIADREVSASWIKEPALQGRVNEINEKAALTQERAKLLLAEIDSYKSRVKGSMVAVSRELDELVDKRLQGYLAKLNSRR
jgi:hypothetical protein